MFLAVESLFFVHVALISLRHQSQTNQPSKQTAVIVVVTTFVVIFFRVHVVTCYTNILQTLPSIHPSEFSPENINLHVTAHRLPLTHPLLSGRHRFFPTQTLVRGGGAVSVSVSVSFARRV